MERSWCGWPERVFYEVVLLVIAIVTLVRCLMTLDSRRSVLQSTSEMELIKVINTAELI